MADLFLGRPRSRRYPKFNIRRDIPPISSESTTVPADDRLRFHDDIEGTGNSREFKRFLSVTHVLLVVAIIIWEGRLRLY